MRLLRAAAVSGLVAVLWPATAPAQLLGNDASASECAAAVGGDVSDSIIRVVCGLPPEKLQKLVAWAVAQDEARHRELLARIDELAPSGSRFREEAVARFLTILGRKEVPPEALADTFARIAEEHLRLREHLGAFKSDDPEVQALREQAAEALEAAEHDAARAHLDAARQLVRQKRETLATALAEQTREEARLVAEQADVERARLALDAAARLYQEAAELVAPIDTEAARQHLSDAAVALYEHGNVQGDNAALRESISLWRTILGSTDRDRVPLNWAMTQNNLGNALLELGSRRKRAGDIEAALTAFKAARDLFATTQTPYSDYFSSAIAEAEAALERLR